MRFFESQREQRPVEEEERAKEEEKTVIRKPVEERVHQKKRQPQR